MDFWQRTNQRTHNKPDSRRFGRDSYFQSNHSWLGLAICWLGKICPNTHTHTHRHRVIKVGKIHLHLDMMEIWWFRRQSSDQAVHIFLQASAGHFIKDHDMLSWCTLKTVDGFNSTLGWTIHLHQILNTATRFLQDLHKGDTTFNKKHTWKPNFRAIKHKKVYTTTWFVTHHSLLAVLWPSCDKTWTPNWSGCISTKELLSTTAITEHHSLDPVTDSPGFVGRTCACKRDIFSYIRLHGSLQTVV